MNGRPFLLGCLTASLLSACGLRAAAPYSPYPLPTAPRPSAQPLLLPHADPPGAQPTAAPIFEPDGGHPAEPRWTRNRVQLYVDGPEIFPAMEALLGRAKKLIQIDYYIFSGRQADRLANILIEKAQAGVSVELMVDPHLGVLPEIKDKSVPILNKLRAHGIVPKLYPIDLLREQAQKKQLVNHDKVIVVDGREAMVGGMNLADAFLNNHDFFVEVEGPAALDLGQNLRHDFLKGDPFFVKAVDPREALVRVNTTGLKRNFNREAILEAINGARQSCYVMMFQLTHPEVIEALKAAHQRGVDVRVILDPGIHDDLIPFIRKAPRGFPNYPAAMELEKAGVRVRWYKLKPDQDQMHGKVAVMDQEICFVGSTNWTTNGLANNNETSLEIRGGEAPKRLHQVFVTDWEAQSEEVKDDGKLFSAFKSWLIRKTYFP